MLQRSRLDGRTLCEGSCVGTTIVDMFFERSTTLTGIGFDRDVSEKGIP